MALELKHFQKKGVRTIHKFGGVSLLADEMGLGKTIQALKFSQDISRQKEHTTVIICPAHLKWNWEKESRIHFNVYPTVLRGMKPSKLRLAPGHRMVILNYDILPGWIPEIKRLKPDLLVLDESHFIKNRKAKRTKAVMQLAKVAKMRIAISGTPLLNSPAELYTTLNFLWPKEFPSWFTFANRYCDPVRLPWGWQYKGATHTKELHDRMFSLGMIRRKKADVLPELPAKTRVVVPVKINLKTYREIEQDYIGWLQKEDKSKVRKAKRALVLTKLGVLKRRAAKEKLPQIISWINNFLESSDEKLVVFAVHTFMIEAIQEAFKGTVVTIAGSTSEHDKKIAERQFQTDDKHRIFLGQIQAAGTGLTLTRASNVLFAELDWVPGNITQAEDRIHRISQLEKAFITFLVAKGTIEEDLCEVIQEKQAVCEKVLDGGVQLDTINIFDILNKRLCIGKTA